MEIRYNFWKNKKVLVTGHTGFKGSWLCLWLNKMGANVSGLSLNDPVSTPNMFSVLNIEKSVKDERGDISDYETCIRIVTKHEPEIVFHLAAQPLVKLSYLDPLKTYNTNILGTANILEAIRHCESVKTIVVITTDKCYENIEKEYAYVETDSLGGFDPYSSSKACAEHIASAYYRSFFRKKGVGLGTVRAGNVIGGGDWALDRLIPDMIKSWSKNEKLFIRYPLATRPWQHVLEPLSGYLMLAEALWEEQEKFSGPWNFGPAKNCVKTVRAIVALAEKEWGLTAKWETSEQDHPHEAGRLRLNSGKANALLGWKPRADFNKALRETIHWYKEYYDNQSEMNNETLKQIDEFESIPVNA